MYLDPSLKAKIVSDDGDEFEPGTYVAYMSYGDSYSGIAFGIIRAIANDMATIERVDPFLKPTGEMDTCGLLGLTEFNVPGTDDYDQDVADGLDDPNAMKTFALPKSDKRPDALPLNSKGQIEGAITVVTTGSYRGNHIKPPLSDEEKSKAKAAIRKAIDASSEGDDWKKQELARLDGKEANASKSIDPTTAIKSVGDGRIGGYLVVYGNPALKDQTGEYFTPETDYQLDLYPRRPILYHHALKGTVKETRIGFIDTLIPDQIGIYAEGPLDYQNTFTKTAEQDVKDGKLSWSSGSVPHWTRRERDGRITVWPIIEGSATPTPAEKRMTNISMKHYADVDTVVSAYKSLGLPTDRFNSSQDEPAESRQRSGRGGYGANRARQTSNDEDNDMGFDLNSPEFLAAVSEHTAKALKAYTEEQAEIAQKKAEKEELERLRIENAALKAAPPVPPTPAAKGLQPSGALPVAPTPAPAAKNDQIVVGEEVRFADMNAGQLALLGVVYGNVVNFTAQRKQTQPVGYVKSHLEEAAEKFYKELLEDPDKKLTKLLCRRTIQEVNNKQRDERVLERLPFKSFADIDSGNYSEAAVAFAAKSWKADNDWERSVDQAVKSNELDNTAQASYGTEWVPTIWGQDEWRRVRIANPFAGLIMGFTQPSNPFNWPLESTDPTIYFIAEGADQAQLVMTSGGTFPISKAGTAKAAFTAKKLGAHLALSLEMQEDSIIPVIPAWQRQTNRAMLNYVDDTIVNGDTTTSASTNINLIDGTPTAGTSYLAMDGMFKYCLLTNSPAQKVDFGGGAPTLANFRAMRKALNKHYAADIPNLVYVVGFEVYMKMLTMPEFSAFQNSGQSPTPVTGLLPGGDLDQVSDQARPVGLIDGIPVYISAQIALGDANGKIPTAGGTLGRSVLFHRTRWGIGTRRPLNTNLFVMPQFSDTVHIMSTVRFSLAAFDITSAVTGYDIAV